MGVDPGSQNLGYGVVRLNGNSIEYVHHDVIQASKNDDFYKRVFELSRQFSMIVEEFRPQWLSVEKVFLGRNADSAFKLGHIRGICIFEGMKIGASIAEYATREIKKGITGSGSAEKMQVALILETLLNRKRGCISEASLDASDALAAAYHHAGKILSEARWSGLDV